MNTEHPWIDPLQATLTQQACVLVSLRHILGSAPRESGCRMIVTTNAVQGSIGGGNLEFSAIAKAREMLENAGASRQWLEKFGLGPELNQCCGGAVSLLFEYFPAGTLPWLEALSSTQAAEQPAVLATRVELQSPCHYVFTSENMAPDGAPETIKSAAGTLLNNSGPAPGENSGSELELTDESGQWWLQCIQDQRPQLLLFGAGHVGQEVAQRIRGLPFRLRWIDQRTDKFPDDAGQFAELVTIDPVAAVAAARSGGIFVVMTHSHTLDEDICHAILQRQCDDWDFRWLGLIGSATKRKRFVHRLKQKGIGDAQLQRLVCPIGLAGIRGKQPATIAISLLAQLMMGRTEEKY